MGGKAWGEKGIHFLTLALRADTSLALPPFRYSPRCEVTSWLMVHTSLFESCFTPMRFRFQRTHALDRVCKVKDTGGQRTLAM